MIVVFVETSIFTKAITTLLNDDSYAELQQSLALNPEQGDLIPNSGGLRKIRWKQYNKGKRGGIRVIYYHRNKCNQILLLYVYPKSKTENLTLKQLLALKQIVEEWQ